MSLSIARDRRDWPEVVRLIAAHWPELFDDEPEALDEALRATPLNAFQADPRAAAVRDIRLHTSADAVDRVLGSASMPDPADIASLEVIARSDRALHLLSVAAGRMIALRVRGRMTPAICLAVLVERLGHIAMVHQPALIESRLPSALLQAGITRGLADDLQGAAVTLRDAYERSPHSRTAHVGRDAAAKSALFLALAGEIDTARRWLQRHDDAPTVTGWHRPRVELSADLARALVAIESLDEVGAETAVHRLEQPVNSEQNWAAAVTFAVARHALAWGDRLGALEDVSRDRLRFADYLGDHTTLGPLLCQAEVDLRLSVGQWRRAQDAMAGQPEHPLVSVAAARTALFAGEPASAAKLTAAAIAEAHSPRVRMEALGVQVAANLRLSQPSPAANSWDHLAAAVRRTGARLIGLGVCQADRRRVAADPGAVGAGVRDLYPALAEPLQLTSQQRLVLAGLAAGEGLKEIAARAHLSYNTVKTHAKALYRRLDAKTRDEALARAFEAGLL